MTKATDTLILAGQVTILYTLLYTGIVPTPSIFRNEILPVIPFWALVSFGCYSLGSLGYDVVTFKDKPKKYQELLKQIDEAKSDLGSKGVDVS